MKGSADMYDYTRHGIEKKIRPHTRRKVARKIISTVLKLILLVLITAMIGVGIYAYTRISGIIKRAPDISGMTLSPTEAATYICNQEGKRVQKLTLPEANRDLVRLSDVPLDLQHAVVAIEDEPPRHRPKGNSPRGL